MARLKMCPNGHYYSESLGCCPYCQNVNSVEKINDNTIWSSITKNANDLYLSTNVILDFDLAPDGIKRYVEINRKQSNLYLKKDLSWILGCKEDELPNNIDQRIIDIDASINEELLKKNIFTITNPNLLLDGDYYISEKQISSIVPETLLTQILGSGSKLDLLYNNNEGQGESDIMSNTAASCASYGSEGFQNARKDIESKKYLSISLNDNSKKVLCLTDKDNWINIKTALDYLSEDISMLRPQVVIKEYDQQDVVFDWQVETYAESLSRIANNPRQSLFLRVSRQRVAQMISTMLEKLSKLHKNGMVHCDLKPQNVLCLAGGLMPIDGINVKKGEVSAGMTMSYCAPEQILTLPVSPATDIYNLGIMLLSVVDCIVYGKTSTYVIPTGGSNVKQVKLLSEPMVYIDYESSNIENSEGIVYWKSFLERCLAFEARNRFQNIESFMSEYNHLLNIYPLKNYIEFKPNFGQLSLVKRDGQFEAGWFINAE